MISWSKFRGATMPKLREARCGRQRIQSPQYSSQKLCTIIKVFLTGFCLLEFNSDGDFSLTMFPADKIPQKYAILSHTWGAEEVTFEDLQNGTGTKRAGYKKIRFCGEQAKRDGLQYFWVETPVASTRQTTLSSSMLSTLCSAGTATQLDATSICRMLPALSWAPILSSTHSRGIRSFGKADGSLEDGRSRSFLRLVQSSFSVAKAGGSVTKTH
jgi:hypothetical protein